MGNSIASNIAGAIAGAVGTATGGGTAAAGVDPGQETDASRRLGWLQQNPNLSADDVATIDKAWNILGKAGGDVGSVTNTDDQKTLYDANDIINQKLNGGNGREVGLNLGFGGSVLPPTAGASA